MSAGHLYDREGDVFHPTEWTGSPWTHRHQHGGSVNALFATAAEEAAEASGLRVARLTVDLFRAVPRAPLAMVWRFVHRGRRIARIEVTLTEPGASAPVSAASALLLEERPELAPTWDVTAAPPLPLDDATPASFLGTMRDRLPPGLHQSFEVRFGHDEHGAAAWMTTPLDWAPGTPLSGLQRSAIVADLAFGLSARSLEEAERVHEGVRSVPLINVDTTIHWERTPTGPWFGFRHTQVTARRGTGVALIDLADATGRFGSAAQTLLANTPPTP